MLTQNFSKKKLVEDVEKVIKHSQNYNMDTKCYGVDALVDKCIENKGWFINREGVVDMIYTSPEEITFNYTDPVALFNMFNDWLYENYDRYNSYDEELFHFYLKTMKTGFVSNTVVSPFIVSDEKTIPTGMKLAKSFKYFISDDYDLRTIQDYYSSLIQTTKITGHLCISAHPLDFLSSSENTLNWRSCHALDGDFRAGNLSYMCDSSTLICYIRTNENVNLPRFPADVPWNNKKWRMLIYTSKCADMVYFCRQYPMMVEGAREKVMEIMGDILSSVNPFSYNYKDIEWRIRNNYVTSVTTSDNRTVDFTDEDCYNQKSDFIALGKIVYSKRELFVEPKNALHYNDVLYSSIDQTPYYAIMCKKDLIPDVPDVERPYFKVGAKVKCPICGKNNLSDGESMICWQCWEEEPNTTQGYITYNPDEVRITEAVNMAPFSLEDIWEPTITMEVNNNGTWNDS